MSLIPFTLFGAGDGNRTRDRLITNQLLYRLSYTSKEARIIHNKSSLASAFVDYFGFLFVLFLFAEYGLLFPERGLSSPVYLVLKR